MMIYKILYYDITWYVHAVDVIAETLEAAVQILLAACICTRGDIITYYQGD